MGQVGLSFYQVKAALIQMVLENLGYVVEVREGSHEQIFPLLGTGELDLLVAAWLPEAHANYWNQVKDRAVELAVLYDNAYFFWGVPDYVPATAVQSIADLAKPSVAARMVKTIQGIGPGATISTVSQTAVVEYGLDRAGYRFLTGTAKQWIAAFEQAIAEQRWVILPTWQPQYLNQAYSLRQLKDPKRVFGGENRGTLIATRGFLNQLPARTREILQRIRRNFSITADTCF